jgi:hypothetical protein
MVLPHPFKKLELGRLECRAGGSRVARLRSLCGTSSKKSRLQMVGSVDRVYSFIALFLRPINKTKRLQSFKLRSLLPLKVQMGHVFPSLLEAQSAPASEILAIDFSCCCRLHFCSPSGSLNKRSNRFFTFSCIELYSSYFPSIIFIHETLNLSSTIVNE